MQKHAKRVLSSQMQLDTQDSRSPPKGARGTGDLAMLSEAGLGVALTALLYLQGYSRAQFVG